MIASRLAQPRILLAAFLAAGACAALPPSVAHARKYPEPSIYPIAWQLDFKHSIPKRIVVDVPGQKTPTAYWYVTYTVTNNSKAEQDFLPDFQMVTQDGKIHPADKGIPLPVFDAIRKREANDLLLSAARIAGPLHQGEDQAKDGVAIWEEPLARMGDFTIYVGGLSGEYTRVKDTDGKTLNDADGKPVLLRKTLELNYVIWGDEIKPGLDEVHDKPERWVMR